MEATFTVKSFVTKLLSLLASKMQGSPFLFCKRTRWHSGQHIYEFPLPSAPVWAALSLPARSTKFCTRDENETLGRVMWNNKIPMTEGTILTRGFSVYPSGMLVSHSTIQGLLISESNWCVCFVLPLEYGLHNVVRIGSLLTTRSSKPTMVNRILYTLALGYSSLTSTPYSLCILADLLTMP